MDVSELRDPGRHLIVRGRDTRVGEGAVGDIEFVIVRPSDAPAFVGCGGADCGICGWDSLIEADLNLLQLVDLGYGLCTFIEAEPAWRAGQAERNYARRGSLRVATKYPRIASAWYAERGVNADIVSLHGNIELGPIVGMTDRIVDITATGATLRDNDLVITGRIMDCTIRAYAIWQIAWPRPLRTSILSPSRARHNSASAHGRPNVRAAGRLAPPPGLSFFEHNLDR